MRLIDADKLNIDFYDEYETEDDIYAYEYVSKHQIDEAPSIDIVRCKECRHSPQNTKEIPLHDSCYTFNPDDFCSYGEREGE